jgi:tetratricopeptide (TPR) repeat protein
MTDERSPMGRWPRELSLDGQAGPAPYITRSKSDALIMSALDEAGFGAPQQPTLRDSHTQSRASTGKDEPAVSAPLRKRAIGARYLAAAAVLLACAGVGSASAAVLWYVREQQAPVVTPQPVVTPVATPRPKLERKPTRLAEVVLEQPPIEVERSKPERAPEDLLIEGNRLRAEKRWAKADEVYTRAFQSAPASQAAYVARVASAAVRLEHLDDAAGALARYRSALRHVPDGALSEEILFGIADAYRALGKPEKEREALEEFLAAHPSSPLSKQAQARLK